VRKALIASPHQGWHGLNTEYAHLTADFVGVPSEQLQDVTLLGGLLVAAAGAAGLAGAHPPTLRERADGVISAALLLDGAHIVIHAFAQRRVLLFDVIAPTSHDFRKALDVFARRLTASEIHSNTRSRG
jgi:S-adenosylmethionine/arginine decarboxylase-like enzyme